MSSSTNNSGGGIGICGVLFIVFITLKLCNVIDWSWWWVTSPLWIPVVGFVMVMVAIGVIVGAFALFAWFAK